MTVRDIVMAAAGNAAQALYVEDVFSTYLYTGNGSTQTINNGIDLAGEGGLVWLRQRSGSSGVSGTTLNHCLVDSARSSFDNWLRSNGTNAGAASAQILDPTTTGFTLGNNYPVNESGGNPYVSWTFRKAEKFFDVVTYTGNGADNRQISHSLGGTCGCVIIKRTDAAEDWAVAHRGNGTTGANALSLNSSAAKSYSTFPATSTAFTVFASANQTGGVTNIYGDGMNQNGATYVAYLFAHDAGGFGDSGSESVISCGSFTTDASGFATVNLGYEAQWALVKKSSSTGAWAITDNMRGWVTGAALNTSDDAVLFPNVTNAEATQGRGYPTATGFSYADSASSTYIYIAIRRGPMKTPEAGTEVFAPLLANTSAPTFRGSFPIDAIFDLQRLGGTHYVVDRLRGGTKLLATTSTAAEATNSNYTLDYQTSAFKYASDPTYEVGEAFRRAPGFFDVVCYTGTGSNRTVNHNLGVVPELIIVKARNGFESWLTYSSATGNTKALLLNTDGTPVTSSAFWNNTTPTSSVFSVSTADGVNSSSYTFVAYLFATCAGVSKVGSYTGTGTTLQINCGFTGGARFVLIKRTDSTGDWYVWDTARGIVSGNDPYLLLNSTAAEVTNTDYIDTYSSGFEISSTAPAAINANGGTFIYLAIA